MALAATTIWEFRATGHTDNGGGFNPSRQGAVADLTLQDSPEIDATDWEIKGGEPLSRIFSATLDSYPTPERLVGNLIGLKTSGYWNAGHYEVVAQGTSGGHKYLDLDREPGDSPLEGGIGRLGGAKGPNGSTAPAALNAFFAALVAGNTAYLKVASYTVTSAVSTMMPGTRSAPITVEGYTTTHGDAAAPVVTLNANGAAISVLNVSGSHQVIKFLECRNNSGANTLLSVSGNNVTLYRCRARDAGGGNGFSLAGLGGLALGCEVSGWAAGSAGFYVSGASAFVDGCIAHDGSGHGFWAGNNGSAGFRDCIADTCAQYGFYTGATAGTSKLSLDGCVAYGCALGGFYFGHTSDSITGVFKNCAFVSNGAYGIASHSNGRGQAVLVATAFYGNTSGPVDANTKVIELVGGPTLTTVPFLDGPGGDFRPKTSPAELLRVGFPGQWLINGTLTSWRGYPDIGAVQAMSTHAIGQWGLHADGAEQMGVHGRFAL